MAINFPSNPANGQVFQAEGTTFIWNGVLWVVMDATNFPYATSAEAIAGVRDDVAISPSTAKDAIPVGGALFSGNPVNVGANSGRVPGTQYTNPFDVPILVVVGILTTGVATDWSLQIRPVGGTWITIALENVPATVQNRGALFIVPVGWAYRVTASSNYSIPYCYEYQP